MTLWCSNGIWFTKITSEVCMNASEFPFNPNWILVFALIMIVIMIFLKKKIEGTIIIRGKSPDGDSP